MVNARNLSTALTSIIFLVLAGCQTIRKTTRFGRHGEGSLRRWFVRSGGLGWQVGMALAGWMVLALGGLSRLAERALSGMPRPPHPPPSSPSWSGRGESGERAGLLVESPLSPLPPSLRAARIRAESSFGRSSPLAAANRRLPFPKSADGSVTILVTMHVIIGQIFNELTKIRQISVSNIC